MKGKGVVLFILLCSSLNLLAGSKLADAVKAGEIKSVKKIVAENAGVLKEKIPGIGLPLHYAVARQKPEIVLYMLANGADVNQTDPETGENAVFHLLDMPQSAAVVKKSIEMVKLLAENKADFNVINKENMTALYKYSIGRHNLNSLDEKKDFIRALIDAGAKMDINLKRDLPLLNAVLLKVLVSNPDHAEIAQVLIEKGCPLNRPCQKKAESEKSTTFTEGDTPLHIVIKREGFQTIAKRDMIALLVENGANRYAKNKKKKTPKTLLSRKSPFYEKMYYEALVKTKVKRRSKK